MKTEIIKSLRLLLPLTLLVLLIFSAGKAKECCMDALRLCSRTIVPSLFPFFVLSSFLTKLGLPQILGRILSLFASRIYGISPAGASALIMGFVGGYPAGAAYIAQLEKEELVTTEEGERLIAFCNNSGPAFIIGVMGSAVFGSVKLGLKLYCVHIFSALITGIIFRKKSQAWSIRPHKLDETDTAEALVDSVKQAVTSILNVCGFVVCFYMLIALLDTAGLVSSVCSGISSLSGMEAEFIKAAFIGLLELGTGAAAMQSMQPAALNLALAAAMLSWGGLSVHFQTKAVLTESKIKGTLHLTGRLSSAIIAFITMYLLSLF